MKLDKWLTDQGTVDRTGRGRISMDKTTGQTRKQTSLALHLHSKAEMNSKWIKGGNTELKRVFKENPNENLWDSEADPGPLKPSHSRSCEGRADKLDLHSFETLLLIKATPLGQRKGKAGEDTVNLTGNGTDEVHEEVLEKANENQRTDKHHRQF